MTKTLVDPRKPITVTAIVSPELRERLEQAAAAHDRSLGGEVRAALRRHLGEGEEGE